MSRTILILGMGRMGQALATRMLQAGIVDATHVRGGCRRPEQAAELSATLGLECTADGAEAARWADVIVLCVKPKDVATSLASLAPGLRARSSPGLMISIAAGVTSAAIARQIPTPTSIIRAMPNTACRIGAGVTALAAGPGAADADMDVARSLFSVMGTVVRVEEVALDIVTALSASGIAFAYAILDAMMRSGCAGGLDEPTARTLTLETWRGAAAMIAASRQTPDELIAEVLTPNGTTAAGMDILRQRHVPDALADAVGAAALRARELGRQFG